MIRKIETFSLRQPHNSFQARQGRNVLFDVNSSSLREIFCGNFNAIHRDSLAILLNSIVGNISRQVAFQARSKLFDSNNFQSKVFTLVFLF